MLYLISSHSTFFLMTDCNIKSFLPSPFPFYIFIDFVNCKFLESLNWFGLSFFLNCFPYALHLPKASYQLGDFMVNGQNPTALWLICAL